MSMLHGFSRLGFVGLVGIGGLVAVLLPAASAVGAAASPRGHGRPDFHGYGIVGIHTSASLTGISVHRPDEAIKVRSGTNCTTPFASGSYPAYQSEWINDEAGDWVEIGTGHQCNGFQYWFGDYNLNGTFYTQFVHTISSDSGHDFVAEGVIGTNGEHRYAMYVSGTLYADFPLSFSTNYDQTGLESYSYYNTAGAYDMKYMKYTTDYGTTWYSWGGTHVVEVDSPMCAKVFSNTDADAGENVSC